MEAASPQNMSGDSMGHNGDIRVHETYSEESLDAILIISSLISTVASSIKKDHSNLMLYLDWFRPLLRNDARFRFPLNFAVWTCSWLYMATASASNRLPCSLSCGWQKQKSFTFAIYCRTFMRWFVLSVNRFFFYFPYNWETTFKSLFKESHASIIIIKNCLQAVPYKICVYEFKRLPLRNSTRRGTHSSCCSLSVLRLEIPGLWWLGEGWWCCVIRGKGASMGE